MFGEKPETAIDSIIGRASVIDGTVVFKGGMRIDGHIRGNVVADPENAGFLVVSATGRIDGDVRVARVLLDGEVIGNIHAAGSVELQSRARITGEVNYLALKMQSGAVVCGRLCHQHPDNAAAPAPGLSFLPAASV